MKGRMKGRNERITKKKSNNGNVQQKRTDGWLDGWMDGWIDHGQKQ